MKTLFKILSAFLLIFICSLSAHCIDTGEYYDSQIKSTDAEKIYSFLDDESKDLLSQLGIDSVDFKSLYDITPQRVFSLVSQTVKGKAGEPLKAAAKVISTVIIISAGEAFIADNDKMKSVINTAGVLFSVAVISAPVWHGIESAVSSIGMCCSFMKTLIPVLAGAVIASGNPAVAISFQSWAFAAAQFISSFCQSFIMPVVGAVIAVDISGSVIPKYRLDGITELIKKTVISVLSFTSTLYVSFLGIKGLLADSADSVANKGVKLVISSVVPVVGGALSEAYSGIIGSLTLVKSTLGIFGIVSVCVITLPSVINLLIWIFIFKGISAVGKVFMLDEISKLFDSLSSALTLLNVVLLFNGILFIISMAMVINLK